jgi:hypothetical protein
MEQRSSFNEWSGTTGHSCEKNTDADLIPCIEINAKWITDLNVKMQDYEIPR